MNSKKFNTTGVCVPDMHYMVNIQSKLNKIEAMVHRGEYFVINRPRQYGKTTTMFMLEQSLKKEYLIISISFEGIGDSIFSDEAEFSVRFLKILSRAVKFQDKEISDFIMNLSKDADNFEAVSYAITDIVEKSDKPVILLVDEVDKNSNNHLFLSFLGLLRNKFLLRQQGKDKTFKSVILSGVYDIKNLKIKIHKDQEIKYNSPWNIAVNFDIDMSFTPSEIATMLKQYCDDRKALMDIEYISGMLHYYTDGYPFLVSRLCQIIDEKLIANNKNAWNVDNLNKAVKEILQERNTLFDDLIKNVENNLELREYIFDLIINGAEKTFTIDNPIINIGAIFGYFKNIDGRVKISNRIFGQRLYNYFSSRLEDKMDMLKYNFKENFITKNGLNFDSEVAKQEKL